MIFITMKNPVMMSSVHSGEGRQQHHGEAEHHGGEVLIDEVFRRGGRKVGVELAQQDDARRRRARQHPVHDEELLFGIAGKELARHPDVVKIGDDEPDDAEDEQDVPILRESIQLEYPA